jgi:hypothetical protein
MKSVKNLAYAVLFALILGVSVKADGGDLGTPGIASPSPTPYRVMVTTDQNTVSLDCVPSDASTETSDYLFYEALAALLSVY